MLPRSTFGTHVADHGKLYPVKRDNTKQQASTHSKTQEHMYRQLHHHFATHIDPSSSLHKATNHILFWIATAWLKLWFQQGPKSAETQGRRVWTSTC